MVAQKYGTYANIHAHMRTPQVGTIATRVEARMLEVEKQMKTNQEAIENVMAQYQEETATQLESLSSKVDETQRMLEDEVIQVRTSGPAGHSLIDHGPESWALPWVIDHGPGSWVLVLALFPLLFLFLVLALCGQAAV